MELEFPLTEILIFPLITVSTLQLYKKFQKKNKTALIFFLNLEKISFLPEIVETAPVLLVNNNSGDLLLQIHSFNGKK